MSNLKYAELPARESESLQLKIGDLLLIRSNGSVTLVGKTALVSEKEDGLAYAGYLIRLRIKRVGPLSWPRAANRRSIKVLWMHLASINFPSRPILYNL
ncbi:MAG: hypothetical protein WKG03_21270 [Telluria sp.]